MKKIFGLIVMVLCCNGLFANISQGIYLSKTGSTLVVTCDADNSIPKSIPSLIKKLKEETDLDLTNLVTIGYEAKDSQGRFTIISYNLNGEFVMASTGNRSFKERLKMIEVLKSVK